MATAPFRRTDPVYLYLEVYGLTKDAYGATSYQLALSTTARDEQPGLLEPVVQALGRLVGREAREGTVTLLFDYEGIQSNTQESLRVAFQEGTSSGRFLVTVTITDRNTDTSCERTIPLEVRR